MRVKINDIDHMGNGISRIDNKVVFIPKGIIGDEVDIKITKSHKKYDTGEIVDYYKKADGWIESLCPYYKECGGCNISNLNYQDQLLYKKKKIENIFKKYIGINLNIEIIGSDMRYEYRNKITYNIDNGKIGLISTDNRIIDVDRCFLVSEKINYLYESIKKEDLTKVKKIIIKECDNGLILIIDGDMNIDNIKDKCISIYDNNGNKLFYMEDGYITIKDIKYRVSNKSFFQINTDNISNLYDKVIEYGEFNQNDRIIDLFCGVGSISLYVSKYVKSVLGIEIIDEAIEDAKYNARLNSIDNAKFMCGDVSKLFSNDVYGNKVIVDPPRAGLSSETIDVLNEMKLEKLVYVSCDPMTLVRDINKLTNYDIDKVCAVDMFPQTHHVECVSVLHRKTLEK